MARTVAPVATWIAWICCALGAFACGAGWAVSSPVGSSPDEPYHLASIWCADLGDPTHCATVGPAEDGSSQVRVPAFVAAPSCFAFHAEVSGDCQLGLDPRHAVLTSEYNTGDYPSGFYRVMHVLVGDDVGRSVVSMRLLNLLVAVLLFTGVLVAGSRATRRLFLYALVPSFVPLGWFVIASVNPSSWALIGVTGFGFAIHSLLVVRGRGKLVANAAIAVVATLMAVSSRGDAAVYVVLLAVALCLLHATRLRARPALLAVPLVCAAISGVNSLTSSQVASAAGATDATGRASLDVLVNLTLEFPVLVTGVFGYGFGLGWLDTTMPAQTTASVVSVVGFLVLSGLARGGRMKTLVVLMIAGAMIALPLFSLYQQRNYVGENVQPRYLLPLVPVLLTVIMTGRRPDRGLRMIRRQAWIIWALVSIASSAALYANLRRYVTGYDGPYLLGPHEWWWSSGPGPVTWWVVATIGFAVFASSLVMVSGRAAPRSSTRVPDDVRSAPRTISSGVPIVDG